MLKLTALFLLICHLSLSQHPSGQVKYRSIPLEAGERGVDPDLESIREKVIEDLIAAPLDQEKASRLIGTFSEESIWPEINYADVSRTGFEHRLHLDNTLTLCRVYNTPTSTLYQNNLVFDVIRRALDFWVANDFICDNWWWNEMGTPNAIISILLVMDGTLPETLREALFIIAARANMEASGARPGGDLIQIAGMRAKQALYRRNASEFKGVIAVMATEIKTTSGRGMKPDLSFHHRTDNVISTLTYGTGYTNAFAYWAVKTTGTRYALPESALKLLVDHFLDGTCKSMAYGRFPDPGARNREITRQNALSPTGPELAVNLWKASEGYRQDELAEIIRLRQGENGEISSHSRFFWHSEYFTFQRPGFFSSVRMHSDRNHNMEQPHNEEGLKNHHYADGSNFLVKDGLEYPGIFPVWDWQKIPGTTVVQKPGLPHWREIARKGKNPFTGGVTDERYGAAAFDFSSVHDRLRARKSWFFFDNEYICLGSGITSEEDYTVVTTLEQRLLKGKVIVNTLADEKNSTDNGKHQLKNVKSVIHDRTAYVFFQPQSVLLENSISSGNWRSINHQSWATDLPVEHETFLLWIDHGTKPVNADYAYMVIPQFGGRDPASLQKPVTILENSSAVQAVWHQELQICQAVFYKSGQITIPGYGEIKSPQPCMLLLTFQDGKINQLTVSDPERTKSEVTLITQAKPFKDPVKPGPVLWETTKEHTKWTIRLPQDDFAGKSISQSF